MTDSKGPPHPPMGRLDAYEVGSKKLTIQTEFFPRPKWHIETKVYIAGTLKKLFTDDLSTVPEDELQARVNAFHDHRMREILDGLRNRKQQASSP